MCILLYETLPICFGVTWIENIDFYSIKRSVKYCNLRIVINKLYRVTLVLFGAGGMHFYQTTCLTLSFWFMTSILLTIGWWIINLFSLSIALVPAGIKSLIILLHQYVMSPAMLFLEKILSCSMKSRMT